MVLLWDVQLGEGLASEKVQTKELRMDFQMVVWKVSRMALHLAAKMGVRLVT